MADDNPSHFQRSGRWAKLEEWLKTSKALILEVEKSINNKDIK